MRRIHVPKNVSVKPPRLVAHRGYALRYPENTLPSLRVAIEAGARYIEFDVQMTADGVPVLLHDADLWRTGRLEKKIHDMSIDQVMQVALRRTGERVSKRQAALWAQEELPEWSGLIRSALAWREAWRSLTTCGWSARESVSWVASITKIR